MTVKSRLQFPDTDETIEDANKIKLIVASFVESRAMERVHGAEIKCHSCNFYGHKAT